MRIKSLKAFCLLIYRSEDTPWAYSASHFSFRHDVFLRSSSLPSPLFQGSFPLASWGYLTLYEATARSTKCVEKFTILPECLLSEKKRHTFLINILTLSESVCLTGHEKQIPKFVAHWKVCQKSSQREIIRKNAYKAPKPQRVLLRALHLKFSRSLTNFQASPARQSSFRSKYRPPNHAVI